MASYEEWCERGLGIIPDTQLAETWGVSQQAVSDMRKRHGIPTASHQAMIDIGPKLKEMQESGMSVGQVTKELHKDRSWLIKACKINGIETKFHNANQGDNGKLTIYKSEMILEAIIESPTLSDAAAKLGIVDSSLSRYINSRGIRDQVDEILIGKGYTKISNGQLYPPTRRFR